MAENRKIVPNTGQPHMRPVAYHYYAQEYYNTYIKSGKRRKSYSPVPYTLLFHAIELELKSFLLKTGKSNADLKKKPYRHNLINIYSDIKHSDKILAPGEVEVLKQSTKLLCDKEFQYFLPDALFSKLRQNKIPTLKDLNAIAVKLIQHGE